MVHAPESSTEISESSTLRTLIAGRMADTATVTTKTLRVGIIGFGQWGPNHVRTFQAIEGCEVARICDAKPERLKLIRSKFPEASVTADSSKIVDAEDIDVVVIATPASTHVDLAARALISGKDVLCEKPLAITAADCRKLEKLADANRRILMVGHVYLYHNSVKHLRADLTSNLFGHVYSMDAVRTNLGPFRHDVGALQDLASHDVSIFNYLLSSVPLRVSATGGRFLGSAHEDLGYMTLEYPGNVICHVHTSWLNPRKVRQLTIVGDAKMAVWDDMNNLEPIRYYDKGVSVDHYDSFGEFQMILRDGTITIPKISVSEPLLSQAKEFLRCVRDREQPAANAHFACDVARVMDAAMKSLAQGGVAVELESA